MKEEQRERGTRGKAGTRGKVLENGMNISVCSAISACCGVLSGIGSRAARAAETDEDAEKIKGACSRGITASAS